MTSLVSSCIIKEKGAAVVDKPIRVLQVVTRMDRGGLETMLMNYYRTIDRKQVQFDFLTHRPDNGVYGDEILSMGGEIFHLPQVNPLSIPYRRETERFFKEHTEYKIVHSHLNTLSAYPLQYAMKQGVPVRIAHSHTIQQRRDIKYPIKMHARKLLPRYTTDCFACSKEAGEWLFQGREFSVVKNAIDAKKYQYAPAKEKEMRNWLGIENQFVVGHVGNFRRVKNHQFVLEVFSELLKIEPNSVLLLAGAGELEHTIRKQAQEMHLTDKVKFLGVCDCIYDLMQCFDVFLLPSLYEGMAMALLEAQAAGVWSFVSAEAFHEEVGVTRRVSVLSLSEPPKVWAERMVAKRGYEKKDMFQSIKQAGFDSKDNAVWLQQFYLQHVQV